MADKQFGVKEVQAHTSKTDLYMIIHENVYDASSFVDEHPGGEEVLLDVGGQDATEAFEDVGHSDESREILKGLLIGSLKREAGDPTLKSNTSPTGVSVGKSTPSASGGLAGIPVYFFVIIGAAVAFGAYQYLQSSQSKQ